MLRCGGFSALPEHSELGVDWSAGGWLGRLSFKTIYWRNYNLHCFHCLRMSICV
jgi:hypothetical protein